MERKTLRLEIEITDEDVIRFLEQFREEERSSRALEALKVGVIAIRSASPTLDTAVVEEKFREVRSLIESDVQVFRDELRERLENYFRTEGALSPLTSTSTSERTERYHASSGPTLTVKPGRSLFSSTGVSGPRASWQGRWTPRTGKGWSARWRRPLKSS